MKKVIFMTVLFLMSLTVFAQRNNIEEKSPLSDWQFNELSVTLNGRRFAKNEVPQSWREQSGYALVGERRRFYWLYDTISYHGGDAADIYNRYLPYWVEKLGYVIDFDNIFEPDLDLHPDLAPSSLKGLMQQRGCDVSVTIITGPIGPLAYDIDYLIINEYFKSRGEYKTTLYTLRNYYKAFE
jgi:hypothetical protein